MLNSISSSDYPNRQLNGVSFFSLHELRKSNIFRVIIGHLNMNSVRNKFELLKEIIKDNIDFFLWMVIQPLTALTEFRTLPEFFCIFEKIFPRK